jgi:hypothetical protein
MHQEDITFTIDKFIVYVNNIIMFVQDWRTLPFIQYVINSVLRRLLLCGVMMV